MFYEQGKKRKKEIKNVQRFKDGIFFFLTLLSFIEKCFFFYFLLDGSKHFLNIKIGGKLNSNEFFSLSLWKDF